MLAQVAVVVVLMVDQDLAKLLKGASEDLGRAILIALETAMRCKEIASNPPIVGRIAKLGDSKTGEGHIWSC